MTGSYPASQPGDELAPGISQAVLDATLEAWGGSARRHFVRIAGNSMWPIIQDGDMLLIEHGLGRTRRGDILVFRLEGLLIAHRVLRRCSQPDGWAFVTKGDNSALLDPPVREQDVVGRALAIKRAGRDMRLDSSCARLLGWGIASGTLVGLALVRRGRVLKRRLWGDRPCRLTQWLHRGARRCFVGLLQAMSRAIEVIASLSCWR